MTSRRNSKFHSGFALFYAVLMVSVVLTVSLSLYNITYRQLIISSTIGESQVALYLADSARGCTIFWKEGKPFGYLNGSSWQLDNPAASFDCFGQTITPDNPTGSQADGFISTGPTEIDLGGRCIRIDTYREYSNWFLETTVSGYNRGCNDLSNPRTVERTIFTE